MLSNDVSFLRQIPMFRDLEPAKLKLIALASQRSTYRAGDMLLKEGAKADSVFIIMEGKASVLRFDGSEDVAIAEVAGGSVVGEMGVVLDRPYSGTIIASTPLTALRIDKRTFIDLLTQVPQFSLGLIRELSQRLLDTSSLYVKALSK